MFEHRNRCRSLTGVLTHSGFGILFALLFAGCATQTEVKREIVVAPPVPKVQPAAGSIWNGARNSNLLYTDNKARYVNDLVTIVISEVSTGQNKAKTETEKNSNTLAKIDSLLGLNSDVLEAYLKNPLSDGLRGVLGLNPAILASNNNLGLQMGGSNVNKLTGKGDTNRDTLLKASMTARVVQVLDNGNLIIEGKRQVTVNAEDQFLIITGIIRPDDIAADNTVQSKYIADAKIFYTGQGTVNDKMKPGWLTRIIDWVWPF
jgi:flagellar L-ring protein precursor FlgH